MIETYQYEIRNNTGNKDYKIETRIEYDTKNSYNVTNYFFNGKTWDKDFIDITHNLPTEPSAKKE